MVLYLFVLNVIIMGKTIKIRWLVILFWEIVTCAFLFSACSGKQKMQTGIAEKGDTLRLAYAQYLTIVKYKAFTQVTVRNPWDSTRVLHTYLLVDKRKPLPRVLPQGTVVRIPLERMLVYSAVHCGLFDELGMVEAVRGV